MSFVHYILLDRISSNYKQEGCSGSSLFNIYITYINHYFQYMVIYRILSSCCTRTKEFCVNVLVV